MRAILIIALLVSAGCSDGSGPIGPRTSMYHNEGVTDPPPPEVNDADIRFRYGERVEIIKGFYRGMKGTTVEVRQDGRFIVRLDADSDGNPGFYPNAISGFDESSLRSLEGENDASGND